MITFIWWLLLLTSLFISPPGLNSRGSGFTAFSFTSLTLGNLLVALLFFSNPSLIGRISVAVVAFFLLTDMILILAVPRLRVEEGWVGIATVIWSTVLASWCVLTDRVVEWGKKEEEERLTGRPETRRTLTEWLAILTATTLTVIYILIVFLLTSTLILRALDAGLEIDGERYYVDGEKYQVQVACVGDMSDKPTVLLESGEVPSEGSGFEHWAYNAYVNGTISRYCYWDRPGYAWSENAPSPHSAGMSSDALSEALAQAGEKGPWIAVSAGYGSVVSRIWASRHLRDVTGIMVVDGMPEDLLYRLATPRRGFRLWGYGILSPLGIERLAGALFKGRTKEDRVYGRSIGESGKYLKAQLQENLVANSLSKNEVVSARNILSPETPMVVVSSGNEVRRDPEWERGQQDLTHVTEKLVSWDVVNKAPHQVWKTYEGRQIMEKRLGELVKEGQKKKE